MAAAAPLLAGKSLARPGAAGAQRGASALLPVRPAVLSARTAPARLAHAAARRQIVPQIVCNVSAGDGALTPGSGGDLPVNADTLGSQASSLRNFAFASFWVQLPLTIVSACILIFAVLYSRAPGDVSRWFTLVGVCASFISTFFAHGFLTLARQAINSGKTVSRSYLLQNLVRNTNINLAGIGVTLIGLQASVGTLVSKTMLAAANAPYAAPAPGGTLVSLDVFSLQASTNTLLAHFLSVVFANFIIGLLNKHQGRAATA